MKVGIILADGPEHKGENFADWIRNQVAARLGVAVELLDLRDALPSSEHVEGSLDAFIVMTPERNHSFWVVEERSRFCLVSEDLAHE